MKKIRTPLQEFYSLLEGFRNWVLENPHLQNTFGQIMLFVRRTNFFMIRMGITILMVLKSNKLTLGVKNRLK